MSKVIVYNGKTYNSISALAKDVGISYNTLVTRLSNCSVTEAINFQSKSAILSRDHLGNDYPSLTAMAKAYNMPEGCLRQRLERGMTIEEALTTPIKKWHHSRCVECVDHLGHKFESYRKMCDFWKIKYELFMHRFNNGWSVKDALLGKENVVTDHLGNEFESIKEMCHYWKINYRSFSYRRNVLGMTLEQALTTPLLRVKKK